MRLVHFVDADGRDLYVNPSEVMWVCEHKSGGCSVVFGFNLDFYLEMSAAEVVQRLKQ